MAVQREPTGGLVGKHIPLDGKLNQLSGEKKTCRFQPLRCED